MAFTDALKSRVSAARGALNQTGAAAPPAPASAGPAQAVDANGMPIVQAQTVDLSGANALYDNQRKQFSEANDKATAYASWQNQMRGGAASNSAARAGLAAGGASYLANARQAQMTSAQNLNNVYAQNATNMGNSFGQQAGVTSQAAGQNASQAQQAAQFNTGNQFTLDQQKQAAQSTQTANQLIADVANYRTKFDYLFDQKGEKAGRAQYTTLLNNYSSAVPGTPEAAAAKRALDAYILPFQQQREKQKGSSAYKASNEFLGK